MPKIYGMKLLIVTQVVDTEHPVLGFFHRWIAEFSKHCELVHVITLQAGRHSLPANVHIHSLGKEQGKGRLTYLWRFYKYSWQLRHEYDAVFVHMVPLYVVLGAPLWRLLRKRIGLWYVHGSVSFTLRVANILTNIIFTAVPEGFNLETKKVQYVGHGIDIDRFKPVEGVAKDLDLVTVGRISPSKQVVALIDVLALVRKQLPLTLTIVGGFSNPEHEAELHTYVEEKGLTDAVQFVGTRTQTELPQILNRARVFVTAAQNGSLDKVVLEAMACGLPVVSMAPGTKSLPLGTAQVETVEALATCVSEEFVTTQHHSKQEYVVKQHSLVTLIPTIISILCQPK